jgi:hypothetical protein
MRLTWVCSGQCHTYLLNYPPKGGVALTHGCEMPQNKVSPSDALSVQALSLLTVNYAWLSFGYIAGDDGRATGADGKPFSALGCIIALPEGYLQIPGIAAIHKEIVSYYFPLQEVKAHYPLQFKSVLYWSQYSKPEHSKSSPLDKI